MKRILACAFIITFAVPLTLLLTVISNTKAEAASSVEAAQQDEELRKAKEAGFIALSGSISKYADAVAFCKQQGGRLPRINESASWDGKNPHLRGILIDGFGYGLRPWGEVGLPVAVYWTATMDAGFQSGPWLVGVGFYDNPHIVNAVDIAGISGRTIRAVCVP
jgi:hypothetical protein